MRLKRQIVFLAALVSWLLPVWLQAQGLRGAGVSQSTCAIVGTVINAVSGKPIVGAWITAQQYRQAPASQFPPPVLFQQAFTDAAGRFEISSAGGYSELNVGKDGYVTWSTQSNGCAQRPGAPPYRYPPIRLMPAAVISGRVTDAAGHPLSGAVVQVVKVVYNDMGRRVIPTGEHKVNTDDRGEYRIFGLSPGRYLVAVNYEPGRLPFHSFTSHLGMRSSLEFAYPAYVLYPGTREISKAQEILLAPGQKMPGIDFRLAAHRTYQISGTLSGISMSVPGKPSVLPTVSASVCGNGNENLSPFALVFGAVGPGGKFLVRNVLPGCYDLLAQQRSFNGKTHMAQLRVEMRDHDIDGLHLTPEPLQDIPLRLRLEGSPPRWAVSVFLQGQAGQLLEPVKENGNSLVIHQVPPGFYRVAVESASLSGDGYVKSAFLGTKDILTKSVWIGPDRNPGNLTVVIAEDGAKVMGTVTGPNGKPDKKAFVVLVPAPSLRKVRCFYKSAGTYPSGRFEIRGIRPGSYTLIAWDHAPYLSWFDPLFLKDMRGRGIPLKLAAGEMKTLRLQSISVSPSEGGQP